MPWATPDRKSASDEYVDVFIDSVVIEDVGSAIAFGPSRVLIDDTADEIPTYGGIFRGRPKTFAFSLVPPATPGAYTLRFRMLREGTAWFGERLDVNVSVVIHGDFDRDLDVDMSDYARFQLCLSGEGFDYPPGCEEADLNRDGAVDAADLSAFLGCMSGANRPPGC